MTRHSFGADIAAYVIAAGDSETVGSITGNHTLLVPDQSVSFYTAPSPGGSQVTDLLDALSTPVTTVTTDSNGAIPAFSGPDDGTRLLWADASGGAGPRALMVATDIGADLATVEAAIAAAQASLAGLATVATTGDYSDLDGAPTLADVATTGAYSDLSDAPAPGMQYVTKIGGTWSVRSSTAPDTSRPALWIGPSPAPPAAPTTTGYAIAGDLWVATPA